MVHLRVFLALGDPAPHGPIGAVGGRHRRVDGVVDGARGVVALEGAEGQVVVPGDHGELAVGLVQVVVVDDGAGVAVAVADEVVHHEVAEDLVHIDGLLDVLLRVELADRLDQALLIRGVDVRLCVVEDVGIAVRIVVGVDELHIAGAHAAEDAAEVEVEAAAAGAPGGAFAAFGVLALTACVRRARCPHRAAVLAAVRGRREAAVAGKLRGVEALRHAHSLRRAHPLRHISAAEAAREAALTALAAAEAALAAEAAAAAALRSVRALAAAPVAVEEVLHVEVLAVAGAAAAEAHAVGLVELAAVAPVIAL